MKIMYNDVPKDSSSKPLSEDSSSILVPVHTKLQSKDPNSVKITVEDASSRKKSDCQMTLFRVVTNMFIFVGVILSIRLLYIMTAYLLRDINQEYNYGKVDTSFDYKLDFDHSDHDHSHDNFLHYEDRHGTGYLDQEYFFFQDGESCVIIGNQCLSFSKNFLSWDDAASACASKGGHLATSNPDVLAYVNKNYESVEFWIGGSDMAKEGSWVWQTGEAFDNNFPWAGTNPDNFDGNQNCLVVGWYHGYDDQECDTKYEYICNLGTNL